MAVSIKVSGWIITWMVLESILGLMVVVIWASIKMIKSMGTVSINGLMVVYILDIGVKANSMD